MGQKWQKNQKNKIPWGHKPTNVGKELVKRLKDLNNNTEQIMQTKTTIFGQFFNLSIIKQDNNYNLILSNTDENKKHVVPIDRYELKEVAEFILKYLEQN